MSSSSSSSSGGASSFLPSSGFAATEVEATAGPAAATAFNASA